MIKYFSKAFGITNENMILTTPLVLGILLFVIYMEIIHSAPKTPISTILFLITPLFMLGAFCAGWFYMVKKAVDLNKQSFIADEEKAKASFNLIREFPIGIGEYFFSFVGGVILYLLLFTCLFFMSYKFGMHFIGKLNINPLELKLALSSYTGMKSLISSLPAAQLTKLNHWYLLSFGTIIFFSFITMFWVVEIILGTKNPIKAFFKSIMFIFKNFLASMILFIYINAVNFIVSLAVNAMAMLPIKVYFISAAIYLLAMIINFYFVVYIVVLVFLYYESENNKPNKIEPATISDNSSSGSDSIGEEQSGDTNSQGD